MGNNIHLKRYSVLDELKKALSAEKVKSPGIAILEDGTVYYDKELKRIYPDYKINTGSYNYDDPIIPEPEPEIPTEFSIDKEFYYAYLDGETINLQINSNKPWYCEYDSRICSINPNKSNGNKNIEIEIFPTDSSRDINIKFYVEDKKVKVFNIYQYSYEDTPLTFEILSGDQIYYGCSSEYTYDDIIQYSINGKSWQTSNSIQEGIYINVNSHDKVFIKGNSKNVKFSSGWTNFSTSHATYNISGNIGSLFGDDWNNYMYKWCCADLFNSNQSLISVKNLILPADILSDYCYIGMFSNCQSLINTPSILSATTLADNCYKAMFANCTSLTTTPELPAKTLANNCYFSMFNGCISLINTPTLPATTLVHCCYYRMFSGCTSLVNATQLPATILATKCYGNMFDGCTSLTTPPSLSATILAPYCYEYMFQECISLTTAPELQVMILAEYCYRYMFKNCISLKTAPELPAKTLANNCYFSMFNGCISLKTAPELPATTLAKECYFGMFAGCTSLNYIKCLATNIFTSDYTTNWVRNVSSIGSFIKNGDISYTTGDSGIPEGWNVYNSEKEYYTNQPLTFEILEEGYINLYGKNLSIQYKLNNSSWINTSFSNTNKINVVKGDIIQFRGNNQYYYEYDNSTSTELKRGGFRDSTAKFNVSGNILSLISSDNYLNITTLTGRRNYPTIRVFPSFFAECNIISAKNLILSASNLGDMCYYNMFYHCTNLIEAPELPATTLARACYYDMFYNCTSLIQAPELPATTLVDNCYESMFRYCTSLIQPPQLPATTLASSCYKSMFDGCTSLRQTPQLPATTLADNCYESMFIGCKAISNIIELPAMVLVKECYSSMFYNCNYISNIKCYAIDISAEDCLTNWLYNVSSGGNFYKISSVEYSSGVNGIPLGWSKKYLNSFKVNDYNILSMTSSNDIYYIKLEESENHTITIKNEYPIDWSITSDSGNISFSESSGNQGTFTINIIGNINEIEYISIFDKKLALSYNIDTGKYNEYTFNATEITNTYSTSNSYKVDKSNIFANIFKNGNNYKLTFYINNIKFITNCTYTYYIIQGTHDIRGTWKHLRINNTYPYIYIEVNTYDGSMYSILESLTINMDKSLNINQGDTFTVLIKR